jgi:hypothetical protein
MTARLARVRMRMLRRLRPDPLALEESRRLRRPAHRPHHVHAQHGTRAIDAEWWER